METLQVIFYICGSVGALCTAASFIYLISKDSKNSKRISNLERVAQTLEKDLELRYQPHLWINGVQLREPTRRLNIDLNNKREWCRITNFKMLSGDLEFDKHSMSLPSELEPKFNEEITSDTHRRFIFLLNPTDKKLRDTEYCFEVYYHDRLDINYKIIISGIGDKYKISSPKKIT